MPHIKLDIAPATARYCCAPEAHVLNPNARCPYMRTNPALCVQFDQPLTWTDEIPLRLPECLAAEKALRETEEQAEAWWWAAMEHAWEAITTEYSLQEWRKKNPSFLRRHTAVLVKPDVS